MLVRLRPADRDDRGSTIVTVLVVMLVLTTLALTSASVVMGTTLSATTSRGSIQAKAAADAGLSVAIAEAKRTSDPCNVAVESDTAPVFEVDATCAGNQVTFTSTGRGADGGENTVQAIYEYETEPGSGGDMIFYGNTTFTAEVLTYPLNTDLLNIVIPTGNFTCQAPIPANIVVGGNFTSQGGCTVEGSVIAGGAANLTNSPDTIEGNLSAAATSTANIQGRVNGTLVTGGGINFGWSGYTYPGNVVAGGSVNLANVSIAGSLTLPYSSSLQRDGWVTIPPTQTSDSPRIGGGISRPSSVSAPAAPEFDDWFDYKYQLADWRPYEGLYYDEVVLKASGSNTTPGTCAYFNNYPANGWNTFLGSLTTPTIIDARACSTLSANSGTEPVVSLRTNVVLLAKKFDLTKLTFKPASGASPRVWWIVEDSNANQTPTCSGGAGNVTINHTVMASGVTAMAYTPCVVSVHGNSNWTGSFYGGSFNYGGGLSFYGDPIALPGMTFDESTGGDPISASIGNLISQRDTVPNP